MRAGLAAAVAAVLVSLAVASSAEAYSFAPNTQPPAEPNLMTDGFTGAVFRDGLQNSGNYADNAGEHANTGVVKFAFQTDGSGEPIGTTSDLRVDIPAGLVPNPTAFPTCTNAQLDANLCPRGAQVGTQELTVRATTAVLPMRQTVRVVLPIYNMQLDTPSQQARFSFAPRSAPLGSLILGNDAQGNPVDLNRIDILGGVRDTGDYGLFFTIHSTRNPALVDAKQTFWGVPGAAEFDNDQVQSTGTVYGRNQACAQLPGVNTFSCVQVGDPLTNVVPNRPFLTNPTACLGILRTTIAATSYAGENAGSLFDTPRGAQNCPNVPFNPSASFGPKDPPRDSPTAVGVHFDVPQSNSGAVLGTSHVKRLSTTLPRGVTINPSAGNTIQACPDAQFPTGASAHAPITCPGASRVGSVAIKSPLLPDTLTGSVYVGAPLPGDRYRLFVEAGARGAVVRMKGSAVPDPNTGQLTTTFDDLPQLPFTSLDLSIEGGPTGILASPQDCGSAGGLVSFGPWSGNSASNVGDTIQATACGAPVFRPAFSVKPGSAKSGSYSTVAANITRPDGQQFLSGVKVDLPPGLVARVKGQPRCAAAAAATGSCPANTRVGTARTVTGAGSSPLALNGPVYFTGPYKGAPFGFVTVVRAVAGPYDLGNVVVRQAVNLDPKNAHVIVTSDPLPQVVGGIPLRLRNLSFDVNKAKFGLNPTYCGTKAAAGTFRSALGTGALVGNAVSFAGCKSLKFKPRLALSLKGKSSALKDGGHPGVVAKLRGAGSHGTANFRRVQVALPTSLALDPGNAETLCSYAEALKTDPKCPKGSVVGRATAKTPILEKALTGKVLFAKRVRVNKFGRTIATLPMLVVPLRGNNGVKINLIGTTAVSAKNKLVTTFNTPDAPVNAFDLRINGGKHGILVSNTSVCRKSRKVNVAMRAQNGKIVRSNKALSASGCKATKKKSSKKSKKR